MSGRRNCSLRLHPGRTRYVQYLARCRMRTYHDIQSNDLPGDGAESVYTWVGAIDHYWYEKIGAINH